MNVRTFKTELDPKSLTFMFGLLSLYPLRSSALEAKYSDNYFVDEEDEARSSSGVLILEHGCDISATLEPHLKQNLSPRFTSPHLTFHTCRTGDTKLRHFGCGKWRKL